MTMEPNLDVMKEMVLPVCADICMLLQDKTAEDFDEETAAELIELIQQLNREMKYV